RPPAAESPPGGEGFVKVQLGLVNASQVAPLADAFEGADWGAAEVPAIAGSRGIVVLAYLASHAADAADLIGRVTFEPLTLPPESSNLKDHLQHLSAERDALGAKQQKISERIKELAKLRDLVIGALGAAENDLHRIRAIESFAVTGRMAVLSGYVRTDDLASLQAEIDKEPDVAMVHEDPDPGKAPISLKQSRFMRPGQFLIKMFGMPRYGALDPSPFVLFTFLLFFGFCFGDVFYGVGLIVMGGLLCRRLRHYPGLRDFFMLLTYAGFSSVIIGALTGSWAADLLKYLGPLEAVPRYFAVFDPLAKPVIALLIVIGIGVTNQLYAMILRIKDSLCRRDPMGVLDGVLWLTFLPALILIMVTQMSEMPAWVGHVALALLVVSSIGLVLTQGREQKGIAAKAITGVVSLYGILGSYGGVTFIGDILSYSRLLALGLTTFIVGISFNIIAALLKDVVLWGIPVGILLFIIVVLIGHVFNFFIGILGAFVHSGRLVFVEFFGRFYSAEGKPFEAYGPMEDRVKVTT
ncbi:MAG: hypothetical protein QGD94_09145, partial [Planctomycetia bacterium]|nr:hypothetical protein [Planctomycetia bacterium]